MEKNQITDESVGENTSVGLYKMQTQKTGKKTTRQKKNKLSLRNTLDSPS